MPKPKSISLAEAVAEIAPVRRGTPKWHEQLATDDPDLYDQVMQWIDDWNAGHGRDKLASKTALAAFIAKRAGLRVKADAVIPTIDERAANGKATH